MGPMRLWLLPLLSFGAFVGIALAACGARSTTATPTRADVPPDCPVDAIIKRPGDMQTMVAECATIAARRTPVPAPTRYDSPTPAPAGTVVPGTPGASGIEGTVLLGPTCPVEREDSPCPPRPGANLAVQIYAGGEAGMYVANVRTDDDGRFRIDLPPGAYTLDGPCSGPMKCIVAYPRLVPTTVTVESGAFTEVTIRGDTGIR